MEEELESAVEVPFGVAAAAVVVAAVVVILGAKMGLVLWWKPRRIEKHFLRQGIGGPPYRFFIGNFKELVSMMAAASSHPMPNLSHNILPRVLSFYHHWKKIYGSTFVIWFGPIARVAVSDPDMIREIFITNSHFYEKNEAHPLVKQLEGDGLLTLNGPKWALHRKIISPTFHMDNLKKWSSMTEETTSGEVEIDVFDSFQMLTEDVITKTAFSCSYEDGKAIFKLQTQQMILASQAFQKGRKRNFEKNWAINEKGPKDLLGLMIQASISVNDIVEECKSFFFAGKQTTSNLMTWTTVLLAMHPRWQILARHEVFTICGPRALPSSDDVSKFKILSMILNESLRLYPPTVATIRRANADVELGGRMIPRGTEFLIPILAVHHDQTIWGNDASEFNPERFSDGVSRAGNHPVGFIPFGLGVRNCIGQNLAVLEAKLAMVIILQRLSFRLAPTYQHAPAVMMLLYPQYGAPILFEKIPLNQNY
ncbi:Cytochrome P450, partial [Cucurbita argyrosperma subsp. argyrosperma]